MSVQVNGGETVAERVQLRLDTLPRAERRAGRALLAAYPVLGLDTAASFAQSAAVSAPTIIRFVKSIGFNSFREFQAALRDEVRARGESALSQATRQDVGATPNSDTFARARDVFVQGITHTFATAQRRDADLIVEWLADRRRRIVTFGGTYSWLLASHLVAQLAPLRSNMLLCPDNALMAATVLQDIKPGRDVWVALDFRRYQPSSHALATEAASRGAKVALVTDRWLSPIASVADVVMTCQVEAAGPSDTLVPGLALIEALCERTAESLGAEGLKRLEQLDPIRERIQ